MKTLETPLFTIIHAPRHSASSKKSSKRRAKCLLMLGLMPVAIRGAAAAAAPVRFSSSVPRLLHDERAAFSPSWEKLNGIQAALDLYIYGQFALGKSCQVEFLEIRENSLIVKDPCTWYVYSWKKEQNIVSRGYFPFFKNQEECCYLAFSLSLDTVKLFIAYFITNPHS